ncbi:molybdopterin-binding oxidoreductase [Ochrobactrum sp. XJ1]|nr:molybdopterin-binding oxidoreductase [Ochrobactrum sp. XJ1]
MQVSRRFLLKSVAVLAVCSIGMVNSAVSRTFGELIIKTVDGQTIVIPEAELLAQPQAIVNTHTAWTTGRHEFKGLLLTNVLAKAGIDVSSPRDMKMRVLALNDYVIYIPLEDAIKYKVLVAAFMDGKRLTVSDKGPYWLVYPRDEFTELKDSRFDHRWVWQLKEISIIK